MSVHDSCRFCKEQLRVRGTLQNTKKIFESNKAANERSVYERLERLGLRLSKHESRSIRICKACFRLVGRIEGDFAVFRRWREEEEREPVAAAPHKDELSASEPAGNARFEKRDREPTPSQAPRTLKKLCPAPWAPAGTAARAPTPEPSRPTSKTSAPQSHSPAASITPASFPSKDTDWFCHSLIGNKRFCLELCEMDQPSDTQVTDQSSCFARGVFSFEEMEVAANKDGTNSENRLPDTDDDTEKTVQTEDSPPGADGGCDGDVYVPMISQRATKSELLLECEEEELEPWQKRTSQPQLKEEADDGESSYETDCKPDLSLLQRFIVGPAQDPDGSTDQEATTPMVKLEPCEEMISYPALLSESSS